MKPIEIARARLVVTQPFFGTLLCTLPLIEDYTIPTASTDMKVIRYNPDFIAEQSQKQIEFVLVHEVLHVALLHGARLQGRDMRIANIAMDYVINWLCKQLGFELIDGVYVDKQYADMSFEAVYDLLVQDPPPPPPSGGNQGKPDDSDGPGGDQPAGGQGTEGVLGQDVRPIAGDSAGEQERVRQDVMGKVSQAATMARQAGKMPGELARVIDKLLHPQVPWYDELREYMKSTVAENENWNRRNRRFQGIHLPTRYSESMGEVICIGDTSGSYSDKELQITASEITAVADQCSPDRVRVLWADSRIQSEEVFEQGDPIKLTPTGGGGTDMRIPLEYSEQFDPAIVILLTDGYTPWPDSEPPYPLIVCCTTDAPVPVGHVIRMRA